MLEYTRFFRVHDISFFKQYVLPEYVQSSFQDGAILDFIGECLDNGRTYFFLHFRSGFDGSCHSGLISYDSDVGWSHIYPQGRYTTELLDKLAELAHQQ